MKAIGGFYELLLPRQSIEYHKDAIALSSGRACIRTVIKRLKIKKCYLPNYTCDAIYDPFDLEGVDYDLYAINESLEPVDFPELAEGEYFYYINYFGVKSAMVERLYDLYGDRLLIDNTHDFFKQRQHDCFSFTSARKYFGVPDGAFLYAPMAIDIVEPRFSEYSLTHSVERLKGNQSKGFEAYKKYEKSLNSEIYRISELSEKMLSLVNIEEVKRKRRDNFLTLHSLLQKKNVFTFYDIGDNDTPFAYPFLPHGKYNKTVLYSFNIYIPTLWADPLAHEKSTEFETRLATSLLPLPIDERYNEQDMSFMAEKILKGLNNA
ncbi:hypothetical protein JNM87_05095 [Candidatus Saccharibacteria bacterium]|nr:hypothetical protein [Candidatus Saccharibacteria bacterium]